MPLNPTQVKSKQPGVHADGGGLYLVVRESGERVWAFRFTAPDGKRGQMEFAKVGDKPGELSLTAARDQAREYRLALKKDGVDPRHKKQIEAKGGTDVQGLCGEEISGLVHGQAQRRTQVVGTVDPRRAEPARPQAT